MLQRSTRRCRNPVATLALFAGWLAVCTGCGKAGGENTAVAAPTLSLAAESPKTATDDNRASQSTGDHQQTDPAESAHIRVAVEEDETAAVIKEINTNVTAWDAGKPFDFKPAATQIEKWLAAGLDQRSYQLGTKLARMTEMTGSYDLAKHLYAALATAAEKSDNPRLKFGTQEIANSGLTRLNLLGTSPKIEGTLLGGEPLDWSKYRGKVVLLDFWATWCGPCMHELPNVKKVFEKYHDQGFDVVGITLDDDKNQLTQFLDQEKLPWPTLFDDAPDKHGFEGVPLVKTFGIDGIPATYLFDRKGKLVSISARGEELETQVKKLLAEKK